MPRLRRLCDCGPQVCAVGRVSIALNAVLCQSTTVSLSHHLCARVRSQVYAFGRVSIALDAVANVVRALVGDGVAARWAPVSLEQLLAEHQRVDRNLRR